MSKSNTTHPWSAQVKMTDQLRKNNMHGNQAWKIKRTLKAMQHRNNKHNNGKITEEEQ